MYLQAVDVPFSGWGWPQNERLRGRVLKYEYVAARRKRCFIVVFPLSANTEDVSLSWPELFGEQRWGESTSEVVLLVPMAGQQCTFDRSASPKDATWDMRRVGAWIDRNGSRVGLAAQRSK